MGEKFNYFFIEWLVHVSQDRAKCKLPEVKKFAQAALQLEKVRRKTSTRFDVWDNVFKHMNTETINYRAIFKTVIWPEYLKDCYEMDSDDFVGIVVFCRNLNRQVIVKNICEENEHNFNLYINGKSEHCCMCSDTHAGIEIVFDCECGRQHTIKKGEYHDYN